MRVLATAAAGVTASWYRHGMLRVATACNATGVLQDQTNGNRPCKIGRHRSVVQRYAFRRWSSHAAISSRAVATLRQLFRLHSARLKTVAFHCWCRATAERRISAATARVESLKSREAVWRRRGVGLAVMVLVRTLERGHDRSIKWGFRRLSEAFETSKLKVREEPR